jgi:diacylglycerol O-acyltransferase / wax synthase
MRRMHGIDAFSIYSETPTSPFATLKVAIYRPVDENDAPDIGEVSRFVKEWIAMLGVEGAGMRIVRVPFDLHHPVWVADPDYSPADHIYHAALPAPGDKAKLCEFLSDLMGRPLDPDRPLWEIWLLEGLEGGKIAVAMKVHHAMADGKTVAALIAKSHSKAASEERATVSVVGEPIPDKAKLIRDALIDLFKTYTDELPHFYRELKKVRQGTPAIEVAGEKAETPQPAPFTVLNEKGGGRYRIYRYETFSLLDFKTLSRIFDCSLNTVVMGVCSEALKRYLSDVDTPPSAPLLAAMPMGEQGLSDRKTRLHSGPPNNSLAVTIVPLHQDIADFGQRLQAIKRSSQTAIARMRRSYGRRFDNYLEFLPGTFIRRMNDVMKRQQAKRRNPYANVVISNVPGPREPLYALGGRLEMVELLSTGNLTDLGHLNITVWSYVDHLCISFYMRKGVLPEPEKIPGYVREVVNELYERYPVAAAPLPAS